MLVNSKNGDVTSATFPFSPLFLKVIFNFEKLVITFDVKLAFRRMNMAAVSLTSGKRKQKEGLKFKPKPKFFTQVSTVMGVVVGD
jgi:hypothetical protein